MRGMDETLSIGIRMEMATRPQLHQGILDSSQLPHKNTYRVRAIIFPKQIRFSLIYHDLET